MEFEADHRSITWAIKVNWPHWLGTLTTCKDNSSTLPFLERKASSGTRTYWICAAHLLRIDCSYCWIAGSKFNYYNYVFNYLLNPHFFTYISNTLCSALFASSIGKLKRFSQLIVFPYEMSKSYNRHKSDTFHDKPRSGTVYLTESVYSPVILGLVTRHNSTILIIYVRLLRTIKSKWYYKGRYAWPK